MLILKILVVEDDEALLELYRLVLQKEGFQTLSARNGSEAFEILEQTHIDLVITDIMMPVMDGYEFVTELRRQNPRLPVLMITAKQDFPSKNKGFTLGADDYMTKPVDTAEMILRVKALLRRSNISAEKKLCFGDTCLDYDSLTVTFRGQTEQPTPKEFYLLYKLLSYPGKIFTRVQLMEEIWGLESQSDIQTIDVHINRLRRRFEKNTDFEILTIRGLGYKAVIRS